MLLYVDFEAMKEALKWFLLRGRYGGVGRFLGNNNSLKQEIMLF